jgi:hypothetical protein
MLIQNKNKLTYTIPRDHWPNSVTLRHIRKLSFVNFWSGYIWIETGWCKIYVCSYLSCFFYFLWEQWIVLAIRRTVYGCLKRDCTLWGGKFLVGLVPFSLTCVYLFFNMSLHWFVTIIGCQAPWLKSGDSWHIVRNLWADPLKVWIWSEFPVCTPYYIF